MYISYASLMPYLLLQTQVCHPSLPPLGAVYI